MKSQFSTSWLSSTQPRKQRKYRYNAPLHARHKFLSAPLSKELRKQHGKRSIPIRKGDEVLIVRGSFKGKKGKILTIDTTKSRVTVENINRSKKDGTKVNIWLNPSKLRIESAVTDDSKRFKKAEKKQEKKNASQKK